MIKDYVTCYDWRGKRMARSDPRFTYLYDVPNRRYWAEMLHFFGTKPATMPELVPAGADLGPLLFDIADRLPRAASYTVNSGALDDFFAMVGTGSYRPGSMNASAGAVLSLAMLTTRWQFDPAIVFFPSRPSPRRDRPLHLRGQWWGLSSIVAEHIVAPSLEYDELEQQLGSRDHRTRRIFLPYLTGMNPPDFDAGARGGFLGLHLRHDRVDLAYAVMEGVAHLLRRNVDHLAEHGQHAQTIISSGGGTASPFWNQLKADACALELRVPEESEAACRGAAVLALVAAGVIADIADTDGQLHRPPERKYRPRHEIRSEARYQQFVAALRSLYSPPPVTSKSHF